MKKFFRLLHTLRYLKARQVLYRIYYRFRKPKPYTKPAPYQRNALVDWSAPAFMVPSTHDGKTFTFLGTTAQLNADWNSAEFPKLWLYNLHYQDDLNSVGAEEDRALCRQLVDGWITANPPLQGNGWEPYCISLRVVNWVKWLSRLKPEEIKPEWVESLASQVDALDQQLEYHILANHLFANAKALVFAGVFFGGQQGDYWLQKGLKLVDQEVAEQFLADGAHYELSPMYHAILLWDLADLICLQQNTKLPWFQQRSAEWKQRFAAGLQWLQSMVHPDQDLSFFNDATLGIAPTLSDLTGYAEYLGIEAPVSTAVSQLQGRLLVASGYAVIDWPANHRLVADLACVGPDYQPGHAHADTLSCELSLFGQRVFVNSGISQYGEDAERHRQRSTAAHNTLEVDGENSSEVWAGFRVARRARPLDVDMRQGDEHVVLNAAHDGYRRLAGKVTHQRQWLAESASLTITDELAGRYTHAIAYWHLHPDIGLVRLSDTCFELKLPQRQVARLNITGADVEVRESTWHPGFGKSISNQKLVLKLSGHTLKTQVEWSSD
ncbi:alginate lyase family protein [Marinobacterium sp. MBR-109]|jgi:uncharacterized heparinase superfamily protein|uniref:heparinase II/III family protein n=1 Tax=Marinobacterium sp. MBR-109 TaxID=3156462 RepID=UPI003399B86E